MNFFKLLSVAALLLSSVPTYAEVKNQKNLRFSVKTEALLKDEIHYSLSIVSSKKLTEKYPELAELDSLRLLKKPKVQLMVAKTAYIVDKPIGFFDHQNVIHPKFVAHMMSGQKVKNTGENSFSIQVPGEMQHSYKMKTYFDSDDISTLPNSSVIHASSQAKKLDVISGSAPAIIFKEFTDYTNYSSGAVELSSYIPLRENKTLILSYHLNAIKKPYANAKKVRENFIQEIEAQRKLMESYK